MLKLGLQNEWRRIAGEKVLWDNATHVVSLQSLSFNFSARNCGCAWHAPRAQPGNRMNEEAALSHCPVCGAQLALPAGVIMGELLECDDCDTELEVIALGPVELKETPEAPEEEEWSELEE